MYTTLDGNVINKRRTTKRIKKLVKEIKEKILKIDVSKYGKQSFGEEIKYTYQKLLDRLEILLTKSNNIAIEAHELFYWRSTSRERSDILVALAGIDSFLEKPQQLVECLSQLEKAILPFYGFSTKAEKLSEYFKERSTEIEKGGNFWLLAAYLSAGLALILSIWWVIGNDSKTDSTAMILARSFTITIPLAGAWFCTRQYAKYWNTAEDYAYKSVLTESVVALSEKYKNKKGKLISYEELMKTLLYVVQQHPLRNHKKQDLIILYGKLLDKIKELLGIRKKDISTEIDK